MSIPDFSRAQYAESTAIQGGNGELTARQIAAGEAFPMAVLYGVVTAALCTMAYAFVWSFGFMFGIIVVGFAWLIAKAMLMASKGYGGKLYQIVAVILTYFTVSVGELVQPMMEGIHRGAPLPPTTIIATAFLGPLLDLKTGVSGIIGILILGYAIRRAWRTGKGTRTA